MTLKSPAIADMQGMPISAVCRDRADDRSIGKVNPEWWAGYGETVSRITLKLSRQ